MTYYKVLPENRKPPRGQGRAWQPGVWRSSRGKLVPCENGLHYCRDDQLVEYLSYGPSIWTFEPHPDAEILDAGNKLVCSKGRIVERLTAWDERSARLFAADCAERALLLERKAGREPDARSWAAVQAARKFARGEISQDKRVAAWAAAVADAVAAAWAAAVAAGESAAEAAGEAAAVAAAWAAAVAAGQAAAEAAERKWQSKRLFEYAEGRR